MAERQGALCPFSGHAIAIDDVAIPVECPICGSVRRMRVKDRQKFYWAAENYPDHPRRFTPSQTRRKRWKRTGEKWIIVTGE